MVFQIISFLGLIIGIILSNKFKSELKDIKKFLQLTIFIIFIAIILRLTLLTQFNLLFFMGLILGALLNYFLKNNYLFFGSILTLNFIDKLFFGILIFIYGLIYPGLNKIDNKKVIISLIFFALPFILLLTSLDYSNFIIGFSIGGMLIGLKQHYK
ncbi:MAG: hypothetical protein AABW45_02565 [Nanoarchaeota archaeon]